MAPYSGNLFVEIGEKTSNKKTCACANCLPFFLCPGLTRQLNLEHKFPANVWGFPGNTRRHKINYVTARLR